MMMRIPEDIDDFLARPTRPIGPAEMGNRLWDEDAPVRPQDRRCCVRNPSEGDDSEQHPKRNRSDDRSKSE